MKKTVHYAAIAMSIVSNGYVSGMEEKKHIRKYDEFKESHITDLLQNIALDKNENVSTSDEVIRIENFEEKHIKTLQEAICFGDLDAALKKLEFQKWSFSGKQAIFGIAERTHDEDTTEKLIAYLESCNKQEGLLMRKLFEVATRRWSCKPTTDKDKLRRAFGLSIRENYDKGDERKVELGIQGVLKVQQVDESRLSKLVTSLGIPDDTYNGANLLEEAVNDFLEFYPTKKPSEFQLLGRPDVNGLMLAAQMYSMKHIKEFIDKVDVNAQDAEGKTALHYCNNATAAKRLVKKGAQGDIVDLFGRTALFDINDLETVHYLVENKLVDPKRCDNSGKNVLFFCRDKALMEFYIKNGVDVNGADELGETPIFAHGTSSDLIQLLLDNKASINHRNKIDQNALFACSTQEAALLLIQRGIDQTIIDKDGKNAQQHLQFRALYSPLVKDLSDAYEKLVKEGTILG